MKHPRTVEYLCWLYEAGRLEYQFRSGLLSREQYDYLTECVENGTTPPDNYIREAFPRPFKDLGDACTVADMRAYWHTTRKHIEERVPVHHACVGGRHTVPRWPNQEAWDIHVHPDRTNMNAPLFARNIHGYDIRPGQRVYVSGDVIAERLGGKGGLGLG